MPNNTGNTALQNLLQANTLKQYIQAECNLLLDIEKHNELAHKVTMRGLKRNERTELEDAAWAKEAAEIRDQYAKAKEEWKRGYSNDWVTSTYAILAMAEQLMYLLCAWNLRDRLIVRPISDFLVDNVGAYLDHYLTESPPEKALPKLQNYLEIGDDGKLSFDSLSQMTRSDGKPMFGKIDDPRLTNEQKQSIERQTNTLKLALEGNFREGVKTWLNQVGYELKRERNDAGQEVEVPDVYVNKLDHNTPLTKERLKQLLTHPDHQPQSLDAFLKGRFEMDFHAQSPGMGMGA
jgi:hypothetical protein